MTRTRITAARDVVEGQKILMNGTFWTVTDVTPGEPRVFIDAVYDSATITLRAPNNLTVSVVEEFYPGRPLVFCGRSWLVQSVFTKDGAEWVRLTHGTTHQMDVLRDALKAEVEVR